jgi:hypothetical protein
MSIGIRPRPGAGGLGQLLGACGLGIRLGLFLGKFLQQVLLPVVEFPGNDDPDLHQQVAPALALGVESPSQSLMPDSRSGGTPGSNPGYSLGGSLSWAKRNLLKNL